MWQLSTLSWTWPECEWVQKNLSFMLGTYTAPGCLLSWQGDLITRGCVKLLPGWDKLVVQVAAGQENTSPGGMMEPRPPPWPAPRHGYSMVLWPFHPSGVYLAQQVTGSALLSWSGKYSRLKHGVKTQIWAVTYASFLAIMVFSTMDRYFILSR